jgi:glycerophosphoryl diester phosphodiesterase
VERISRPWVIAHRGTPYDAPENTLISFERAIQQGADLIELDVRQTADRHLVIIHDETLDRTTNGSGTISAATFEELQALDAGAWMGKSFEGEKIPTLADVLTLTRSRAGLVIEIKAGSHQYPHIERRIVSLLEQQNRLDDIIIISADRAAIDRITQCNNQVATLSFDEDPLSAAFWEGNFKETAPITRYTKFVFCRYEGVTVELVNKAHRRSIGVLTSLVQTRIVTQAEVSCLTKAGVDGIFTNDPSELKTLLTV